MTLPESIAYLRRYQAWRTGKDNRDFIDTGLTPEGITHSIDNLLNASETTHILQKTLSSTKSQLKKCQVQREKFHSQLRKQANYPTK